MFSSGCHQDIPLPRPSFPVLSTDCQGCWPWILGTLCQRVLESLRTAHPVTDRDLVTQHRAPDLLFGLPGLPRGIQLQTPRMETGLIIYSLLASFSSLSHFPIPLLIFPGIIFLITYLHSPPGLWENPQKTPMCILVETGPFNINSTVYMSSEVPVVDFKTSEVLWCSLDGKQPFWYNPYLFSSDYNQGDKTHKSNPKFIAWPHTFHFKELTNMAFWVCYICMVWKWRKCIF